MEQNSGLRKQLGSVKKKVGFFLNDNLFTNGRKEIFLHEFKKQPSLKYLIVPDLVATEMDEHNSERLLSAYHKAIKDYRSPENDLWSPISKSQAKFFNLLNDNNPKKLAQYLCNMNREDATIGTVQGNYEYDRLMASASYRKFIAVMTKDKLVGLAEAMGVLPLENPEQGHYGQNIHENSESLYHKISAKIGFDITPPAIDGGLLKLEVGNALINERDCNAIYTGYIIKDAKKVCEIGGGSGRVCFWGSKFGIKDYTILDLPHINVVQGFYLLKSTNNAVSLYGEKNAQIKILPCHQLPDEKFDLVLNQDSFPEIGKNTVVNYLNWIKTKCVEFLSINHESKPPYSGGNHINVYELIEQVGGFNRTDRYSYWLRKGYTIEKYQCSF